jgi:fimbrial isopeptide formation D2 family protein/uncharacterized repeat protein (TIGR01451 family)
MSVRTQQHHRGRWPGVLSSLRSRVFRTVAGAAALAVVTSTLTLTSVLVPTDSAAAAPGNPGTPSAPAVLFNENFNNRADLTPIVRLSEYAGATGQTYTASQPWLVGCNGWIAASAQSVTSPAQVADCQSPSPGSGQGNWNSAQQLADVLGRYVGVPRPDYNFAVTAYTANNPGANQVEFATASPINLPAVTGRFLTFSVDVATTNCPPVGAAPGLNFSLVNSGGALTPVGGTINPCLTGQSIQAPAVGAAPARPANVGTYTSNGSVLMTGSSFGIQMTNATGSGGGNDHAFDNMRVLDVTPQLDKSFADTSIGAGGTTTLTFTVTNTSELAAKQGWSFTDALPAGMTVAGPASTTCTNGVLDAPVGGSSIGVSGDLITGQTACTISVGVTASAPGTYTNGPGNVTETGLNPPGETSLIVYPFVTCTTDPAIFNTGFNAATGGTVATGGIDQRWTVAGGATGISGIAGTQLPPAGATFAPAEVGKINSLWADSPFGNAQWISGDYTTTGQNQPDASAADWYYRYQFVLADEVDVDSFSLDMNWLADNAIAGVWVNDAPQAGANLPQGGGAPYTYAGFVLPNAARTTLDGDWRTGLNTIMVQVKSAAPAEGFDAQVQSTALCAEPNLDIDKTTTVTADSRPGDTATFTVTATNDGTGPYTAENPAFVADTLAGVLDDGAYNGDAVATINGETVGAPSYSDGLIQWTGPLAVGETVTITYTVTLGSTASSDGEVRNVAWEPNTPPGVPPTAPACDPVSEDGTDPVTGEPCAAVEVLLPRLTVEKTSDVTELPANGGEVTYTVTVTNEGPGVYSAAAPATVTDDLSEVLDDAEFGEIVSPATGAEFDAAAEELTWSGPLAVGESATITYTVTYDSTTGDNILFNVACVPAGQALPGADNCETVRIPAAALEVSKSVNPASGTIVDGGQTVTYTLTFANSGQATATVNRVDNLSDVLDDAALVPGSIAVSADSVDATLTGTELALTGSVPAGDTITVTYSVTVNAFAEQGNHNLANVVQNPDGPCEVGDCPSTENPIRHFSVTKMATPTTGVEPGDVVTYTVTVTNDGGAEYTGSSPAGVSDDMTDVLDDAAYNSDGAAEASNGASVQAPTFNAPVLAWSGPVAVGESVEITYSVTVTNLGDADLSNVASPVCAPGVVCDPPVVVDILLPRVTPSKTSDPASGTSLAAGAVVTYTLSFTNDGQATGPLDSTDDLSDVLDDTELIDGPDVSVDSVTSVFDATARTIRTEGDLAPGATVTVTYQVRVLPDGERGNNTSKNTLTPEFPPREEFPPPFTEHFIGELDDWKTVDPSSGGTVLPGQVMTYTLHFENIGKAPVAVNRDDVLTQVLDDATVTATPVSTDAALTVSPIAEGRFAVTGSLAPGQLVTVTYQVTVNADGARGDDRLGNFIVNSDEEPPTECVPADNERPDCTVNYVSNVVVTKSANPASGTNVAEGQQVTYTLTFRNVSANPDAADAAVDYTDHMAGVLDDATLTRAPLASAALLTPTTGDQNIRIAGAIPSGETVTVTYIVTVKAWSAQGDHTLGNIVAVTGGDPICAPGSQLCTTNPIARPTPLASTGLGIDAWVIVTGLALLVGGGVLLVVRRRRGLVAEDQTNS